MKLNRTYDAISNIVYKTCQDKTVITKHMHLASNRRMDPYSPTWANLSELTAIGTNKIVTLPCRPRSEWSPSSGKVLAGRWVSQRHSRLPEPRPAAPSGGRQSGRSHTALLPPCPGANGGMGLMKGRNKKEGVRKWAFPVFYNSFANSKCWTLQFWTNTRKLTWTNESWGQIWHFVPYIETFWIFLGAFHSRVTVQHVQTNDPPIICYFLVQQAS